MDKEFIFSAKKTIACSHCQESIALQVCFQSTPEKTVLTLEPEKGSLPLSSPSTLPLDNNRVVVAVEGEGTREWIKELLEASQFEVIEAVSAEALFFAIGQHCPATILVDFSYLAFLKRTQNRAVVIVVSSGYVPSGAYANAPVSLLDAEDYVERRFIQRDLVEKIKFHLNTRRGESVVEEPTVETREYPWSAEVGRCTSDSVGLVTEEYKAVTEVTAVEPIQSVEPVQPVGPGSEVPVSDRGGIVERPAVLLEEEIVPAVKDVPWRVYDEAPVSSPAVVEEIEPVVETSGYGWSEEAGECLTDQTSFVKEVYEAVLPAHEVERVEPVQLDEPAQPVSEVLTSAWGNMEVPAVSLEEEKRSAPVVEETSWDVEEEPVPLPVPVEGMEPVVEPGEVEPVQPVEPVQLDVWSHEGIRGDTTYPSSVITETYEAVTEESVADVAVWPEAIAPVQLDEPAHPVELVEPVQPVSEVLTSAWGDIEMPAVSLEEEKVSAPVVEETSWDVEAEPVPLPVPVEGMEPVVETDEGEPVHPAYEVPISNGEILETHPVSLKEDAPRVVEGMESAISEGQSLEGLVLSEENSESRVNFSEWSQSLLKSMEPPVEAPVLDFKEIEMAKRLARIIVSDIVLYNENKVVEGIRKGTFYTLLQEDIEEGRKHYDARVPLVIRQQSHYLDEAFEAFIQRKRASLDAP